MSLGKKLKFLRTSKKITQTQLAADLGVSRSTISLYELDLRKPDIQFLQRISQYFNVTLDFILDNEPARELGGEQVADICFVPLLGNVPAGMPAISQENIQEYLPLPSFFLPKNQTVIALKINGDSMIEMGINHGDIVLVKEAKEIANGQTVIARINGKELTCKRYYCIGDKITLEPANIHYRALKPENVEIVGIVFKIIKEI